MLVQVGERERCFRAVDEIVEPKACEVTDDDVARQVALFEACEVIDGVVVGLVEVAAKRLVLYEQHAGPEQVDPAVIALVGAALLVVGVLEGEHALPGEAEDVEEVDPKALRFGFFVFRVRPAFGELEGAVFYLVPGERHWRDAWVGGGILTRLCLPAHSGWGAMPGRHAVKPPGP